MSLLIKLELNRQFVILNMFRTRSSQFISVAAVWMGLKLSCQCDMWLRTSCSHCTIVELFIMIHVHCVSEKRWYTWVSIITLANVDRFLKFFHWQMPEEILCTNVIKIFCFTLNMFLHCLVKLENYGWITLWITLCGLTSRMPTREA